jgi:choline-sulfatase
VDNSFQPDLQVVAKSIEWLTRKSQRISKQWLLTVNLRKPHFPQRVNPEYWEMYDGYADLPSYDGNAESANHPYAEDLRNHFETNFFTEKQVRGLRRGYYGCVSFVDDQVGRLLKALRNSGQLEDTNVIYTADHGEMLGKFGMWWKCSLYEDSVRVPCVAMGPDFENGKVVHTPIDLLDVQASVFHSLGAGRPSDWSGVPLQNISDGGDQRVVFSEYHGHGTRSGAFMIR